MVVHQTDVGIGKVLPANSVGLLAKERNDGQEEDDKKASGAFHDELFREQDPFPGPEYDGGLEFFFLGNCQFIKPNYLSWQGAPTW